jgi:poly(3-hydroxybutyrate) depolymerase
MRKVLWLLVGAAVLLPACRTPEEHTVTKELTFGGVKRSYLPHVPPGVPSPAAHAYSAA